MIPKKEPVHDGEHPLVKLPNALCTPHIGFVERDNVLFDNRQPAEAGEAPPALVQATALPASARALMRALAAHPALAGAIVFGEVARR